MQFIKKFHRMEVEEDLFNSINYDGIFVWDILRYSVYSKLVFGTELLTFFDRTKNSNKNLYFIFTNLLKNIFFFFKKKSEFMFFISSRSMLNDGLFMDKSSHDLITQIGSGFIFETEKCHNIYNSCYDLVNLFSRFIYVREIDKDEYIEFSNKLGKYFSKDLFTYDEYKFILKQHKKHFVYYTVLFKIFKPKKVVVSTGNPKALVHAARKMSIPIYLLQHGEVQFDQVDVSYPEFINYNSNIYFPDIFLTFGTYWSKGINIPARLIHPIGNNYYYQMPSIERDNSILFVSSIIHGEELSKLVKELSMKLPDRRFIFKLHPNEYNIPQYYISSLVDFHNIEVVRSEFDTSMLVSKCEWVVLISSTVLFEALHFGKNVAVYKKLNWERQLYNNSVSYLDFIENSNDFIHCLSKERFFEAVSIFEPYNKDLVEKIFR